MSPDQHIEAIRFVAWSLELSCAVVAAHYVYHAINGTYRLGDHLRIRVAIGLVVKCFGWFLNQFYWWIWQAAQSHGRADLKASLESTASITILAYLLIFAGEAMVISPWLERMFGRYWSAAAFCGIVSLWLFGALLTRTT